MINIVANIHSGKGRGLKNLKKVVAYLSSQGIDFALYTTKNKGHATAITKKLTENGGLIIAMGGDGTFHEVLNGISDVANTALGFIPSGRGNDFARAAGFSLDPIEALECILSGTPQCIDYLQIGDNRCLNVAGTGLDVEVLKLTDKNKSKFSYVKSLVYMLRHFDPYTVEVTTDDGNHVECTNCIMVGACNGHAFGGNIRLAPIAKIDDGFMDVIIMQLPPNCKIMRILPKFIKGKHMNLNVTTHFRCKAVTVKTDQPIELDGEIYETNEFDCKIVPGGLKVFLPKN